MSRILLDSHAFLWFLFDDPRLSRPADEVIADPETQKMISIGTLWEITIKCQIGKLELGYPLETFFERFVAQIDLEVVAIEMAHLVAYYRLPLHHRDPFDRLLVAQAQSLNVPIVTADEQIGRYGVAVVW